jgi:RNA polymerase sigma-70 factor (sigma-E family)
VGGNVGQDAAFESFLRANSTSLLRTAFLLTGSHHAAEELLQETLTNLYPQWHRVEAAEAGLAYVRRSLTNRYISSRRSRRGGDLAMWELPDGWDGLDLGETVATRRTIWQLLAALSERQRAAVVLRIFHALTDDQIAAVLDCRPASVRSLISRGVTSMRSGYAGSLAAADGTGTR